MILETKGGYIEKYNTKKINDTDLDIFHGIERDTWAHFLGEYVKCRSDCGFIASKEDIYSGIDDQYKKKTVLELEDEYGKDICCPKCSGKTDFLWGDDYKEDMLFNMTQTMESHMVCYKNKVGEICGFSQGYIDTFKTIGDREFSYKFKPELLERLHKLHDELFITITSTCLQQKDQNMNVFFDLIKYYINSIDNKYIDLSLVSDGAVGSPTFNLYTRMGSKPLALPDRGDKYYLNSINGKKIINDVIIHKRIIYDYREVYNLKFREMLKKTQNRSVENWKDIEL